MTNESIFKTEQDIIQFNEWVIALEHGGIGQTTGRLEDSTGFCCLGVGCALFIPDDKLKLRVNPSIGSNYYIMNLLTASEQPNAPQWLKEINQDFHVKSGYSLVSLNDNRQLTFKQIARRLREVYSEYVYC